MYNPVAVFPVMFMYDVVAIQIPNINHKHDNYINETDYHS